MSKLNVVVNGLPGKMATNVAEHVLAADDLLLLPFSLTGPDIRESFIEIKDNTIKLFRPDARANYVRHLKKYIRGINSPLNYVAVDFTHPSAVNDNAKFYCDNAIPFVMGTTGGDRIALEETVRYSHTRAVIAPNMAKPIVLLQAMMEYAAREFPNVFNGYKLIIQESHQKGKADTSGTAKAMVEYFNKLGIPFTPEQIIMVRNPYRQARMGVPEEHLAGHGWHTYTLQSYDGTVLFEFTHNVNGRNVYAEGTLRAVRFLDRQMYKGDAPRVFSMVDVLKWDGR